MASVTSFPSRSSVVKAGTVTAFFVSPDVPLCAELSAVEDTVGPVDAVLFVSCVLLPVFCEPHAERSMHAHVMSAVILLIFNYCVAAGNGSVSFLPVLPGFLFFFAE